MMYTFREAQPSDATACVKILSDFFDESDWLPFNFGELSSVEEWWCDHFRNEKAWVATKGDQIVGFCSRQQYNNNISALYVVPKARNSGVGKRLLDLAKENCDEIIVWAFELNTEARRFYRREGLVEVDRELDEELNIMDVEHHWKRRSKSTS